MGKVTCWHTDENSELDMNHLYTLMNCWSKWKERNKQVKNIKERIKQV